MSKVDELMEAREQHIREIINQYGFNCILEILTYVASERYESYASREYTNSPEARVWAKLYKQRLTKLREVK